MLYHKNNYVNFAFIIIIQYHEWPSVFLTTLRKYSNNPIIIINHLPNMQRLPFDYYDNNCIIINNVIDNNPSPDAIGNLYSHGHGIDTAINYIKQHNIADYAILTEPDCIVTGTSWIDKLNESASKGYCLAGFQSQANTSSITPLHICPSIWKIDELTGSFKIQKRDVNAFPTHDQSILQYKTIAKMIYLTNMPEHGAWIWFHFWDTGIKNWYELASKGRTQSINNCEGFYHFFYGRYRPPKKIDQMTAEELEKLNQNNDWIPHFTNAELLLLNQMWLILIYLIKTVSYAYSNFQHLS